MRKSEHPKTKITERLLGGGTNRVSIGKGVTKYRSVSYALFILGSITLPFSTGVESGLVFSPGLVFMTVSAMLLCISAKRLLAENKLVLIVAILGLVTALYALVSSGYGGQPLVGAWRAGVQVVGALIFSLLILSSRCRWSHPYLIGRGITLYGVILSVYYILNFIRASIDGGIGTVLIERFVGGESALPWGASNVVAAGLFISLVVSSVSYSTWRGKLALVGMILTFSSIMLTFSRTSGGFALLFIAAFLLLGRSRIVWLLPPLVLLIGYNLYKYIERTAKYYLGVLVDDRTNLENISTLNTRTEIWTNIRNYVSSNPLDPIGYYSTPEVFGMTGHSLIMTTLVEQGPLGVLLQVGFLLFLILHLMLSIVRRRVKRRASGLLLFGVMLVFGGLMIEDPYFTHQYTFMFWVFAAFLVQFNRKRFLSVEQSVSHPNRSADGKALQLKLEQARTGVN